MAANPIQIAMIGMGGMGLPMANAIAAAGARGLASMLTIETERLRYCVRVK
jgi:3-hydroxyisobutyrate dehydrogenase-like beta-hydroxyacid dehydrogenase